ncbi:2'-5' RNA ligase family protein [Arthrobacter monumenti]
MNTRAGSVKARAGSNVDVVPPAGSNLVGIVIAIPEPIAGELRKWRASFGDPLADVVPAHITLVTTTYYTDWDATVEHVRKVARQQSPFRIHIKGTGSFRPVSPVVYLNVAEGFDDCVRLHEQLQSGPLGRDLPFAFHPHVTVAHDVSDENMDDAEQLLESYEASFEIGTMGLYEHDNNGVWRLREELNFGSESANQESSSSRRR